MSQTVVVAIITAVVAVLTSSALSTGFYALVSRLRFDGIAVGIVPATIGAIGLYSHAVEGFGMRVKVVNVTATPIAIEQANGVLRLKPKPGAPKIHGAFGECTCARVQDGPYTFDAPYELSPIVVPGNGGEVYVQVGSEALHYRRKIPLIPYWRDVAELGIDDPSAPTDEEGNRMYFDHFEFESLEAHLQISGKIRKLPVSIRFRETSAKGLT